jgi:hypothetical protein
MTGSVPVAVVLWSGGNQRLENLVIEEKKTTPTNPTRKKEPKLNLKMLNFLNHLKIMF